jgi:hypothetical protein
MNSLILINIQKLHLTGAGANRNQTSEFFANQSSLRTYYGDFLVNFDYDLTDDLKFKSKRW